MLPKRKLTDRQLLYFGASLTLMLLFVAGIAYFRFDSSPIATVIALFGIVVGVVFFAAPTWRNRIHDTFQAITRPIQWLVTVLLLAIVYLAVVTPIGLLLRLRGYDPLARKSPSESDDQERSSHWQPRQKTASKKQYFKTY